MVGGANVLAMFAKAGGPNPVVGQGVAAFGLILNMALFILPGLVVAGIGELLRRKSVHRVAAPAPIPAPAARTAPPPASEASAAKAIVAATAIVIIGGVAYASYSRQPPQRSAPITRMIDPQLEADIREAGAASARASESGDRWSVSHDQSQMDGTNGVTFSLSADNEIEGWLAQNRPDLVVRCREHKTDIYVITGMPAQPQLGSYEAYTVRLRFDAAEPEAQMWNASTDSKALFAEHPIGLARRLATTRTLLFQFTPFNASQVVVTFDVRGFAPHLAELGRVCGFRQ